MIVVTLPAFNGKGGHRIAIAAELLPEVAYIEEESQGLKAVTQRHQTSTDRVELGTPEILWDLNTPEDYQQAIAAQE